jgi:hypothetical protein
MQFKLLDEIKTDKNSSSIAKRNLSRSINFLRYESNISYQYQKQRKYQYHLSTGYAKNFQYPSIDQLYTVVDDINVYDTRIGNPFLRNTINHSFNANSNFSTLNPASIYSFNGNIGTVYTRSSDPLVDSTINNPSGRRTSYFINADKSSSLNFNYSLNVSRKLKKNNIQLMIDGRFNKSEAPNYVDALYNISETGNTYNNITLQYSIGSILVVNLNKNIQYYKTKQTAAGLRSFKNSTKGTRLGVVVNYPVHFSFSSTVEQINNSNLAKPSMLWNSFATYRFMKQQAELKFSAMDILKQYKNITNGVSAYGTITRITNGLQQFFLLTFSYYPRKFGKTDVTKQPVRELGY